MFSRPDVYNILRSKIPPSKIHFNKRILSVGQSDKGVLIRCTDGQTYQGDILIGADGAYSAVRQSLYDRLQKDGVLPKSDTESLNVGYACMVGTTRPLDLEKYPMLKDDYAHFSVVVADSKPHSVSLSLSLPQMWQRRNMHVDILHTDQSMYIIRY
jgi:2-polyprenyl-6-methoxyphenol hydroxylase-like FAD-dependent oxidoreductase